MNETALKVHGYTYCCGITGLVLDAAYQECEGAPSNADLMRLCRERGLVILTDA